MKKLFALLLAVCMALAVAACGGDPSADNPSDSVPSGDDAAYTVGVCQLAQHPSLDAATQGFVDALNKLLPGQVKIDVQNASGEINNCSTIVNGFVSGGVDLIMANATPALTAAASATDQVPILGTSVTAYSVALDLDDFDGTVGGNLSGTSDLVDLKQQAQMIRDWFPDAKTVGLLYCSAEANSVYQVEEITRHLTAMGYICQSFTFTDSNDLTSVTQAACDASDVIYIPTDNTAASNTEAIANVVIPAGVPVATGAESICSGCSVCTLSISYYDLGYATGEMAAQVLTGQADISQMPIAYAKAMPKYNAANCEALNITPVAGYEPIEG